MVKKLFEENVNIMERLMRRRKEAGNYKILKNHKSEKEAGGVREGNMQLSESEGEGRHYKRLMRRVRTKCRKTETERE